MSRVQRASLDAPRRPNGSEPQKTADRPPCPLVAQVADSKASATSRAPGVGVVPVSMRWAKLMTLGFALVALVFCLVGVLTDSPIWYVAGNGFVAALLVFAATRLS
jgi:hypothetical protein